ncbi:DnaB-like helicase N-terminal domain-containing protein [Streptomyces monomycini]|uniref:DnaB-like helicase N-terminal domain-containing protein n=1 Tax=Streptomyces monomycini TaxID=371720 RepID=UPI00067B6248|nr:DnaB-like helicase N-terminal domain-containing protein [Streptomyces monomycini]
MRWLQPDDFAMHLHGQLYECLTTLAYRREPIDAVTVLPEAQHRYLLHADFTPADLIDLLATPVGTPEHWGEQVLRLTLVTHARATTLGIQAFTDDPANTPHQLATGSRRALADLTALRPLWQRATQPATASHAPAVPRAGPLPDHPREPIAHHRSDRNHHRTRAPARRRRAP